MNVLDGSNNRGCLVLVKKKWKLENRNTGISTGLEKRNIHAHCEMQKQVEKHATVADMIYVLTFHSTWTEVALMSRSNGKARNKYRHS